MPIISMFFGIIIRMYYAPAEHNPPHVHAYFQDASAVFRIEDGEMTSGNISKKQIKLIQAWIEIHKEELVADWQLCQNGEKPFKIEPLK